MINAEFLSQCSDEQINKGVAWCNVTNKNIPMLHTPDSAFDNLWCNAVLSKIRPFCSMPDAIMPIAFANQIAIMPDSDGSWKSGRLPSNPAMTFGWSNFVRGYKNPLRAICEVYILMSANK